jgi:dTDP-4-dehydrorhamnose reductase
VETKKIKILVLGANGQLGQEFRYLASENQVLDFKFFGRDEVDICAEGDVHRIIDENKPNFVINCAAYTAVDKAEAEVDQCFAINRDACATITNVLKSTSVKMVHFSTDYVYNSYTGFPIKEDDNKNPQSVYATSKLEGENIIRASEVPALIIRTSWVVSSFGHNFVKTMKKLGAEREQLNVVNDQYGAPTYARHLAKSVLDIILKVTENPSLEPHFNDTYNYANEGLITWYDLASQVMKIAGLSCKVSPIPTTAYPTPASRPRWSVMSKQKIKHNFGIVIPHWYTALKECMDAMK